jgi:hypothetical protein
LTDQIVHFLLTQRPSVCASLLASAWEGDTARINMLSSLFCRHEIKCPSWLKTTSEPQRNAKAIAHPYFVSFYGLMAHTTEYLAAQGRNDKIEFVFDSQVDQMEIVMASWKRFVAVAPPECQAMLGDPPTFRDDKKTVPLQAADLSAGWLRMQAADTMLGRPDRDPVWGDKGDSLKCIGRLWSFKEIMKVRNRLEARHRALSA